MILYCESCWSRNPDWLGRDKETGACCKRCEGGRARARRVVASLRREEWWVAEKKRLKEEAMKLVQEEG